MAVGVLHERRQPMAQMRNRANPWQQRALAALLMVAFLPTLTFLGHWNEIFFGSVLGSNQVYVAPDVASLLPNTPQDAEESEHAQHCHTNLSSCSEQPMPSGIGLLAMHDALLGPAPAVVQIRLVDNGPAVPQLAILPLTPPPRVA
jgi:hypothetical protein